MAPADEDFCFVTGTQEDATSSGSAAKLAFAQFALLPVQNWEGLTSELSSSADSSGLAPDNAIMEQRRNPHDLGDKVKPGYFPQSKWRVRASIQCVGYRST